MDFEWWHWVVLGIVLVLAELAVPAFFVIWFGLGALLVGLALLVAPLGATAQVALWIVASVAMVGLWFRLFKGGEYLRSRTRVGQSDGEPIGEIGLMTKPAEPFARGRLLPALEAGDLMAFRSAGAYGAVMASEYNSRPLVPEVLVSGDAWSLVRPRPTYEEMLARDRIPDWLD